MKELDLQNQRAPLWQKKEKHNGARKDLRRSVIAANST